MAIPGMTAGTLTAIVTANTAGLTMGLTKASAQITAFSNTVQGKMAANSLAISKFALGVSVAFVGIGTAIVIATAKVAGQFEQWDIAFETMLGSAKDAKKMMADLFDFAKKTPFEIPELVKNSKLLLGMGIEAKKIIPTMKNLGDVAAGLGVPIERLALNFGQVKAQTKLTGRELRDFAIAGVPILSELAKNLGKSKQEISAMVSAGKIGFGDVEDAFISMSSEGGKFFNLMERQNKSMLGLWSNMKDQQTQLKKAIGDWMLPAIKEWLPKFISGLSAITDYFAGITGLMKSMAESQKNLTTLSEERLLAEMTNTRELIALRKTELDQIRESLLVNQEEIKTTNFRDVKKITGLRSAIELQKDDIIQKEQQISQMKEQVVLIGDALNNAYSKVNDTISITFSMIGNTSIVMDEMFRRNVKEVQTINEKWEEFYKKILKVKKISGGAVPLMGMEDNINKISQGLQQMGDLIKSSIADQLADAFMGAKIKAEDFFKYLLKQLLSRGILMALNAIFPAGGLLGGLFGEHGGLFQNYGGGNINVPSFAGGVSGYQVPSNIPMDTMPVLVGGGEELDVRSIGQVSERDNLLRTQVSLLNKVVSAIYATQTQIGDVEIRKANLRGKRVMGDY